MNRLFAAASLSVVLCLASGAQAASTVVEGQLSVQDATGVSFTGYDGAPAQFTGTLDQGFSGTLSALTAGTLSFTYLGKEAAYSNAFSFNGQTLFDAAPAGSSLSAAIGAGTVAFRFTNVSLGQSYANGSIPQMVFVQNVQTARFGKFDFVVGFNDKPTGSPVGDTDFDDFVVGVKFAPSIAVPEPGTLLPMAMGLIGLAALVRRRT